MTIKEKEGEHNQSLTSATHIDTTAEMISATSRETSDGVKVISVKSNNIAGMVTKREGETQPEIVTISSGSPTELTTEGKEEEKQPPQEYN